jgi:lipoprotein-releasing system permease protein
LSLPYFISKRLLKNEVKGKKVSRPIVRISIISIALSVVVNLVTIAVVTGFQHEVQDKITGFGSHITIFNGGENTIYESDPIRKDQAFYPSLKEEEGIKDIQYFGYKPVLLQSDKKEQHVKLTNGKDTTLLQQEIHGALLKGVDGSYDLSFFHEHLKQGRLPRFDGDEPSDEIMLSQRVCQNLNIGLNARVRAFFVKNQPVKRIFKVVGIYNTGLEEFDKKMVIADLRHVQELNDWGINASIQVDDTLYNGQLIVRGLVNGSNGDYFFDWGNGGENYAGFTICPYRDTVIRLIVSRIEKQGFKTKVSKEWVDTAYIDIQVKGKKDADCIFKTNDNGEIIKEYLNEKGTRFKLNAGKKTIIIEYRNGRGSSSYFVGGFEVSVKNWKQLEEIENRLKREFELIPTKHGESLHVESIRASQRDIFVWLGFLDVNVVIILSLMLLIGIINMGSALLVLILVRSNFIGVLKSMGASNWVIRKVFLWQAGFLILRGMLIGNTIALMICAIQYYFHPFGLNPEVYYLDKVPIELNFVPWLLLNLTTLAVCLAALLIPSYLITRIQPARSIRFN